MQDLDRSRELIEKYLDGVIDEAELAELEILLTSHPEVAKEFADTSRLDGLAYFHFNEVQAGKALGLEPGPAAPAPPRRPVLRARLRLRSAMEHLIGPTGSLVLHGVVIALLIVLITHDTRPPPEPPVTVALVPDEDLEMDIFDDLPDEFTAADLPQPEFVPLALPEEPLEPPSVEGPDDEVVDTRELDALVNSSPLKLKNYGQRADGGREDALDRFSGGMAKYTEPAVLRALEWLREHQRADGSWERNAVAMTGLGLLTFLAHGETTASPRYGQTVEKAIRYLLGRQRDGGAFTAVDTQSGPYEHAIATYAMSEAYGLTRIQELKPAMEKAVQVILDGQQLEGGWDYKYSHAGRRDTSVAGWQIQALKAAYIAGAGNARLKEAMNLAAMDLKQARDEATGAFRYSDPSSRTSDGINGIAALCLELLGQGNSKEARGGLSLLSGASCSWRKPPAWALYSWYYVTQAKFHEGGADWPRWNNRFARAYVQAQNRDGSWTAPAQDEQAHGPVYSTTLAALTLQVYYRVLPTYKTVVAEAADPGAAEEVRVDVR